MSNDRPLILLTRPQMQSERFAQMCRKELGASQQIIQSPLMKIKMLPIEGSLAQYCGLIFTSENGVRAFVQASNQRNLPAYCVGNRTAQAARAAGLTAHSANGAADNLVAMIKDAGVDGMMLHIRGEHTRGDIAGRLGLLADEVVAYRQIPTPLSDQARAALLGKQAVILPLFSPRTAQLFFKEADQIKAPLHVVVISRAVEQAICGSNIAKNIVISIAKKPDATAVLQAITGRIDK